MTDFSTPTTIFYRRIRISGLEVSLPGILRGMIAPLALCGRAFASILASYGQAVALAYSVPFGRPVQPQSFAGEEDLEGRDPNW